MDHLDLETEHHIEAVNMLSMFRPVVLFSYDTVDPVGRIGFEVFAKAWVEARPAAAPFYVLNRNIRGALYRQLVHRYGAVDCAAQVLVVHCGRCVHVRCEADIVVADVCAAIEACEASARDPKPSGPAMITIRKKY